MARLTEHGLRRSVGVSGLFATAYGNVGSSIYYALGLVAGIALGLTPLVFVISGLIFAATAATYAEGTEVLVLMPELFVRGWRRLLHNQKALYVKRLLLFEPHVVLASVPYQLLR